MSNNLIGQSLGRYHILEQLGEGGMATVYKAYDTRLERDVALKIIRRGAFPPDMLDQILARFIREAKSLARLSHPNIVKVHDFGDYEGEPYLVMEYLHGGTLKGRMGRPIPWQDALGILLPVARGLAYAHARGIIHRDVKPANILISEDGQPMLTDFGIAKLLENEEGRTLTGSGVGIGTPEYMAPEQGIGHGVDARVDIYSLGIVLYELLTGRKPYTADTPMAVVLKQISDPLPRPTQFVPDLPEAVEHLLVKALAKDPADRYEDMNAFCKGMEALLTASLPAAIPVLTPTEEKPGQVVDTSPTRKEIAVVDQKTVEVLNASTTVAQKIAAPLSRDEISSPIPTRRSPLLWVGLIGAAVLIGLLWLGFSFFNKKNTAAVVVPTQASSSSSSSPVVQPSPLAAATLTPIQSANPASLDCSRPEFFCVGVVTDVGKIDDRSFNQSAWEGVKQAETDLGANVKFIETTDSKDYGKNIAAFGDAGYDVIVTVGFALGEATASAAASYPNTRFIGVDQFQDTSKPVPANLVGLNFPEDQAGFLVGALAAQMTSSKKIGGVLGTDAVPPVWRFGEGYRAGAAFIDPAIEVDIVYHNDVGFDKTFTDPEWGAITASAMIDKKVDVIFGAGGKTGNGAVIAAAQKGVYAIGVDSDQYYTLPEAQKMLLTSAIKLITPGVFNLIDMAKNGNFPSGNYYGAAGYAPFHDLDSRVSADIKGKMADIARGLLDGTIKTGVSAAKP